MGFQFDVLAVQGIHGLVYGMLLFLVSSGLTLVFGMMGVLNLAHAAFYMLGAYAAYTCAAALGSFWWALIVGPVSVAIIGMVTERFLLRPVHKRGHIAELLLTFGLFYIIGEIIRLIWGNNPLPVPTPAFLQRDIPLLGVTYPLYRLFILAVAVAVLAVLSVVLLRTRIGILIRAAVSDGDMVNALGTNVPLVFLGVFGAGSALAALAGVIAAPFLGTYPGMGITILLDCFVVIVIGGMGSLFGAFVASLMIGELQSYGVFWVPRLAMVLEFLLMVAVLIVRPTGLFGEKG